MAIGHYINKYFFIFIYLFYSNKNGKEFIDANVMYFEYTFNKFPLEYYQFIPNTHYNGKLGIDQIKSIVLIALEDIQNGDELFASYFNLVK